MQQGRLTLGMHKIYDKHLKPIAFTDQYPRNNPWVTENIYPPYSTNVRTPEVFRHLLSTAMFRIRMTVPTLLVMCKLYFKSTPRYQADATDVLNW